MTAAEQEKDKKKTSTGLWVSSQMGQVWLVHLMLLPPLLDLGTFYLFHLNLAERVHGRSLRSIFLTL